MRHGDGATMACLHLRRHIASGAARHVRSRRWACFRKKMLPSRAMEPLGGTKLHEPVIGGMALNSVDAPPPRIEILELRGMLVCEPAKLERGSTSCKSAKGSELFVGRRGAFSPHSLLKRRVGREQIHSNNRRALIESLFV